MMPETHLYIIILILLAALIFLAVKLGNANYKIDKQELKILSFNAKELAIRMNELILNSKLKESPKLTPTTEKLLVLAAKSNNENEASAAAVQACKRIHKELGYK